MGDRNNETKMVQSFLTALKLLTVPKGQDGIFGPRTKAAVILYQKKMHLKQTGIVDAATIKVMAR
ncbi:MAG: peptidoglycan-binding domain-containing protein [Candidatus Magasanikbacteria bacterium]|nr:peptidoglycan-binding domain-containing protein [Candidatus Magasanikbacteria bacterium]